MTSLYFVFLMFIIFDGTPAIRITDFYVPAHATVGDTALLRCSYDMEEGELYSTKWYHNGVEIYGYSESYSYWSRSGDVYVDRWKSNRTHAFLSSVSSGVYRCEVTKDKTFETVSREGTLLVTNGTEPPSFLSSPGTFVVDQNDTVRLPCSVANRGNYETIWTRVVDNRVKILSIGRVMRSNTEGLRLLDNYTLEITSVKLEDAGFYHCQISTNPPLSQWQKLVVKGIEPPLFLSPPKTFEVYQNDTVRLPCSIANRGSYIISWSKIGNGESIFISVGSVMASNTEGKRVLDNFTLEIAHVKVEDAGRYYCSIDTEDRMLGHLQKVVVKGTVPIKITDFYVPTHVPVGGTALLRCSYDMEGGELYSTKWYYNGVEIYRYFGSYSSSFRSTDVYVDKWESNRTHALLYSVSSGVYRCDVTKEKTFETVSREGTLIVTNGTVPPSFLSSPGTFEVDQNDTVRLLCSVANGGDYVISWLKIFNNGSKVLSIGRMMISNTEGWRVLDNYTLEIAQVKVEDAGSYQCFIDTDPPLVQLHKVVVKDSMPSVTAPSAVVVQNDVKNVTISKRVTAPLCTGCNLVITVDDLKKLLSTKHNGPESEHLPEDTSIEPKQDPHPLCDNCNFLIAHNSIHMEEIIETIFRNNKN